MKTMFVGHIIELSNYLLYFFTNLWIHIFTSKFKDGDLPSLQRTAMGKQGKQRYIIKIIKKRKI